MVSYQSATDRGAKSNDGRFAALLLDIAQFIRLVSVSPQRMLLWADGFKGHKAICWVHSLALTSISWLLLPAVSSSVPAHIDLWAEHMGGV